jgi:hypothetical protein
MLLPPDQDIDRRRLVWSRLAKPLFDFVFDEETIEADYRRTGRAAIDSGYTDEAIKMIYWREVVPAVAGSWFAVDPLDPAWLEYRVLRRPILGCLFTCLLRPWWIWVAWDGWRETRKGIETARRTERQPEKESFADILASIKDIGDDDK